MEAGLEGPSQKLPTGTITFLFTDIEGSVANWEMDPEAMRAAVARHHAILHAAAEEHGGHVFKIVGDEFQISFPLPAQALQAALAAQRALRDEAWGTTGPLKVRMGLHTGPAGLVEGVLNTRDYAVGRTLNRVSRIRSAGHGGQVLVSLATVELLRGRLPPDVTLDDLGLHYFKGLAQPEHIFQVNALDLPTAFPALTSIPRPRHNLPVQLTPFVGREREIAQIKQLLEEQRLVTVLGAGGTGKTRLALEVALAELDRYADGVFFVALAPLQRVEEMVPAVARALGFSFYAEGAARGPDREQRVPKEQLLDYVRRKQLLLVMDNFEHLLPHFSSPSLEGGSEDGTQLVTEILQTAPQVDILVSSRTRLNLQGEHFFHLAGMRYPEQAKGETASARAQVLAQLAGEGAAYSAVQLFTAAAGRVQAGFELTAENAEDVVRICRLVDGMPLGLLLAAAWVELLTPREIADEIAQSLDFLETELRDVPKRQRSLRATFDHSWRLLTERERELLAGLSVFQGGFGRVAAEAVTGATLRELMSLTNRSLVERDAGGRYRLHELIRQYAAQRLRGRPELDERVRDRHCAFYIEALHEAGEAIKGPRQQAALAELDLEIENARAAWDWAAARGEVERLDQALEGLCLFYNERLRPAEAEAACRLVAEKLNAIVRGAELRTLARVLAWQASYILWLGLATNAELARQLLEQGVGLLERPELTGQDMRRERAFILLQMGQVSRYAMDYEAAKRWFEQSLTLYRALDETWWAAHTLYWLSDAVMMLGLFDQARNLHIEGLELWRALGDRKGLALSMAELSLIITDRHIDQAERFGRESVAILRELGDEAGLANGLFCLGMGLISSGKYVEGQELMEESAAISDELGIAVNAAWARMWSAFACLHLNQRDQAQHRVVHTLDLFREKHLTIYTACSLSVLGMAALAGAAPGEAVGIFEESIALFRQAGTPEPLSRELANLGLTLLKLNETAKAQWYIIEALQSAHPTQLQTTILCALASTALLLASSDQPERAVELYALAYRYPQVANSHWFEDVVGREIADASADLPPEVVAAAQERGRARDLMETVAELLVELEAAEGQ
jgi:predicted ATPase/class 3 adenylate cyclase